MSKKLLVEGLTWEMKDADLRAAFEPFGEILDAAVVTDRETGRSRGYGHVTFAQSADAQVAIAEMDATNLDGRTIRVFESARGRRRGRSGERRLKL